MRLTTIGGIAVCAVLCAAASLAVAAEGGVAGTKPAYPFFAFQNGLKGVPLEEQPKLLKELGYDGMEFQTLPRFPEMLKALDAQGLKMFSLYTTVYLAPEKGKPPYDPLLKTAIAQLKGRDTQIWLPVVGGTPSGTELDDQAVAIVREIADMAEKSGLRVAFYPHAAAGAMSVLYVQTVEDAVRLIKKIDRKNVGTVFNLSHFLKLNDEKNLEQCLKATFPYLLSVNINGADGGQPNQIPWDRLIQTLDHGNFDAGRVLKTLMQLGYTGPVGLQCFAIPGDCRTNLARSMTAWRKLCKQPATAENQVCSLLKGGFAPFETPPPISAADWDREKPALRAKLWKLLGVSPPTFTPKATIDKREAFDGYVREHVTFDNGVGDTVYGYLLIPTGAKGSRPAVLYHHYHGGRFTQGKEELFVSAFAGMGNDTLRTGPALVRAGYVVFCIDAYSFGQRQHQGPAGQREVYPLNTEVALVKTFLLEGRSFWGMIVRDDVLALNYLVSRPEVASERIAALGMSMGSMRAWWLAALDDRVKVAISVSCLPRCQDLIRTGDVNALDYSFAPGMLKEKIDTESIVGLIAPRAHLALSGDRDTGSPVSGVHTISRFQEHLYRLYGKEENFRGILYPGVGHEYTPAMWEETIEWLKKHL